MRSQLRKISDCKREKFFPFKLMSCLPPVGGLQGGLCEGLNPSQSTPMREEANNNNRHMITVCGCCWEQTVTSTRPKRKIPPLF